MANQSTQTGDIVYQLKITLLNSPLHIWRRIQVPESISLSQLHDIIQIAMGWTDSHLHQFTIDGKYYSLPGPDDWQPVFDERRKRLKQIAPRPDFSFVYEYDFGDSWEHDVLVEGISLAEPGIKYPNCLVEGEWACPPEDVGGVWGFENFLQAMRDPEHEEHDEYLEWWGGQFDPNAFDLNQVNRDLQEVR